MMEVDRFIQITAWFFSGLNGNLCTKRFKLALLKNVIFVSLRLLASILAVGLTFVLIPNNIDVETVLDSIFMLSVYAMLLGICLNWLMFLACSFRLKLIYSDIGVCAPKIWRDNENEYIELSYCAFGSNWSLN